MFIEGRPRWPPQAQVAPSGARPGELRPPARRGPSPLETNETAGSSSPSRSRMHRGPTVLHTRALGPGPACNDARVPKTTNSTSSHAWAQAPGGSTVPPKPTASSSLKLCRCDVVRPSVPRAHSATVRLPKNQPARRGAADPALPPCTPTPVRRLHRHRFALHLLANASVVS